MAELISELTRELMEQHHNHWLCLQAYLFVMMVIGAQMRLHFSSILVLLAAGLQACTASSQQGTYCTQYPNKVLST